MPTIRRIDGSTMSVSDYEYQVYLSLGLIDAHGNEIGRRTIIREVNLRDVVPPIIDRKSTNKQIRSYHIFTYRGYKPNFSELINNLVRELKIRQSNVAELDLVSWAANKLPYTHTINCKNYGSTRKYLCKDDVLLFKLLKKDVPLLEIYEEEYCYKVVIIERDEPFGGF